MRISWVLFMNGGAIQFLVWMDSTTFQDPTLEEDWASTSSRPAICPMAMWALLASVPGFVTKREYFIWQFFSWRYWDFGQFGNSNNLYNTLMQAPQWVSTFYHPPFVDVKTKHWSSQNWVIKMFDDGILMPAPCSCHNCHLTRGPVTL